MAGGLRHPDWYLVSEQRFRRRATVSATPQSFRGERFVVLSDALTGQHLRLSRRAARLWEAFDGETALAEIWRALSQKLRDAPTQGEVVDWVLQLVSAGLLLSDHTLDPRHLSDRGAKKRDAALTSRTANPLAIKLPIFDPQRLIAATYPLVRPLFSPAGAAALVALVVAALVVAAMNLPRLTETSDQSLLSQSGLLAMFLSYPLMKALHELAHGWAVHHHGGQVREAGVMLLIFVPVPYVDASAASAFPDPRARMLVGAAGVIAEVVMAALALFAWLMIEPGVQKAFLYSIMVMGTVSTLFFNGNPLLKFDAYYVLADWLEMPNLATRASKALSALCARALGLRPREREGRRDAVLLVSYALLSLAYRLSISLVIALVVSLMFFALGLALAAWSLVTGYALPFWRFVRDIARQARAQNLSRRVLLRAGLVVAALGSFGLLLPLPFAAPGQGQIVTTPEAELTLEASGVFPAGAMVDGALVAAGDVLVTVENPDQTTQLAARRLALEGLGERLSRAGADVVLRRDIEAQMTLARAALAEAEQRDAERSLRAPLAGRLSWQGGQAPRPGTFAYRGDAVGRILAPGALEVLLSFPSAYAGELVPGAEAELRLPDGRSLTMPLARLQVLDAGGEVPPPLRAGQGGPVPESPQAPGHALAPTVIATALPTQDLTAALGMRVEARVALAPRPLFVQWAFHLRRLFLRVTRV